MSAKLIYSAITSLDGYVADEDGKFDWAEPDEEVHVFVNDLERPVGTYLYGRRMYDVMVAWETIDVADQTSAIQDFAGIWRKADKIVYSRTLETAASARTRIEREFDPEAVRQLKAAARADLSVGGPELAAHALTAGWSTSCTSSSPRSSWEAARGPSRTVCGWGSRCWTNDASATAWCTSTTRPGREATAAPVVHLGPCHKVSPARCTPSD
jgi:dihydrofolate reductase